MKQEKKEQEEEVQISYLNLKSGGENGSST